MPITTTGASMRSACTSGCRRAPAQSDAATDCRPYGAARDEGAQCGVHFGTGLRRKWVHAEPAELERHRTVGHDHAHHREVAHRHLAQRPPGETRLRVVVEA